MTTFTDTLCQATQCLYIDCATVYQVVTSVYVGQKLCTCTMAWLIVWLRPKRDTDAVHKFQSTLLFMMPYATDLNAAIIQ